MEDLIRELEAKIAWLEGKGPPAMCGYPWDQPYQDGYDAAKEEFSKTQEELLCYCDSDDGHAPHSEER